MVNNNNFHQKLNKYMFQHHFFPLLKYTGCSNVQLQLNNTLKHEIKIDNLKNQQKMLSSQNNFSWIT
jgi:hypothetical protein